MSGAYFNEFDAYPAAWLGNLWPAATVDERSIADVQPADVAGYTRAHFFAGIGGWEYAIDLAGWPTDRPVWTGSCPCQPFSVAGRGAGAGDARHLWPELHRLIAECRPPTILGEQVAGRAGLRWLAGVRADLEALGYVVGAADLCAASVGAPHIRQRIFWGAWLADAGRVGVRGGGPGTLASSPGGMQDADGERQRLRPDAGAGGAAADPWSDFVLIPCADGKARRVGARIHPLAHGVPARAPKLRAYGNAIVPQVAAEFVMAFAAAIDEAAR